MLVFIQFSLAVVVTVVGLIRLFLKKGPTAVHLIVWLCLLAGIPFGLLRQRVLFHRIESIGAARLLQDARDLSAEVGATDPDREEIIDGRNLLVPRSMRALNPLSVTVREDAVVLTIALSLASRETLILMTDPAIDPGPIDPSSTGRTWKIGGDVYSERWLAPGTRWDFWGT